jgi:predicted CDP-diglyceride synthetase/phosphatidate cytidylyltransferase
MHIAPIVGWVAHWQLSTDLRNIAWVWPLCETIHFIGLAMVVGVAGFFDLRLLGFFNRVPITACKEFMPWAMIGFALNMLSGIVFLMIFPAQYVYSQTWWFKVFFLLIAGANALIFETRMGERMVALPPGEASPAAFRAIGALSL